MTLTKGQMTMSQITAKYGVHSTQIFNWKKQALEGLVDVFTAKKSCEESSQTELIEERYKQIGQLKVELDWVKKSDLFFS